MNCSLVAWEYVSSQFSRDNSFTSRDVFSPVIPEKNLSDTENHLAVWGKCLYLEKIGGFTFLMSVFDNLMSCIGGVPFVSIHICFLPLLYLKHTGER